MSAIATNPFYFPAHEVQRPTHDRIHIRSAEEAHMLFESVRLGILRPVIRRLNDAERSAFIRSGSVFVWEESEEAIGLRRWTDGLMWSPSRMREPFLFYESKRRSRSSTVSSNNGERLSTDTLASTSSAGESSPRSSVDQGIPGLVKQTYSAIVMGDGSRRKWHMTAYFTNADYPHLPTIQDDSRLRGIKVPKGMYRSGKSRQSAKSLQEACQWNGSTSLASASSPDLHFSSQEGEPQGQMIPPPTRSSSSESASPSGSPLMEHPRRSSPPSPYSRPPSSHRRPPSPYSVGTFPPPTTPNQPYGYAYGQQQPHPQALLQPPTPAQQYSSQQRSAASQQQQQQQPRNHVLPPLQQSTYADQRYVPPVQRPVGRTAEDERMLQKFRPIP